MRILLEEVVFDLPRVVDAERVGVLDLVERILDQAVLGIIRPRTRQLVFVEDAELHRFTADADSNPSETNSSRMSPRRGCDASACSTSPTAWRTNASRFAPSDCSSALSQSVPSISVPGTLTPESPTNVRSRISV